MTTDLPEDEREGQVIDLALIVGPVQRLLGFWERMVDLDHEQPHIRELDEVVKEIKALPDVPGRLGADIALIACGGADASRAEIIDAMGRLRRITAVTTDELDSAGSPPEPS